MQINELDRLWDNKPQSNHKFCTGCGILGKPGEHGIDDYSNLKTCDVLFLGGSYVNTVYGLSTFREEELKVIGEVVKTFNGNKIDFLYSVAVKCPNIREADIDKDDRNICRSHVEATIDTAKPKLIYACGELAYIMLFKRKGCSKHRGVTLDYTTPNGTQTKVIPLFHPWQVVIEPKNKYLFQLDIVNGINQVVLNKIPTSNFEFDFIDSWEKLKTSVFPTLVKEDVAIDIETTGLNFLKDKINTIAFSWRVGDGIRNICIPIEHKDSPFNKNEVSIVLMIIQQILKNPNNKKIFHNGKFDLKFLARYGVTEVVNVWDTKLCQHLINESLPKRLSDLVKYYFPLDNIN